MSWLDKLDNKRGSQPRCVLFMHGEREGVAERLTELVNLPYVKVSPDDKWIPCGKSETTEVELDKADGILSPDIQQELGKWWLEVRRGNVTTPVWDIASTCKVNSEKGLILIEAKAHDNELKKNDNSGSKGANRKSIAQAFDEANCNLHSATGGSWNLALTPRYQLSNRFAWSWKLASLGIPVVLVYLGFLKACEVTDLGQPFCSNEEWKCVLKEYGQDTIDNTCWEKHWDFSASFIPLIRSYKQCFNPDCP